jgi:hypothetical protein
MRQILSDASKGQLTPCANSSGPAHVQNYINGWIERKNERDDLDVTTELVCPPRLDVIDSQTMHVVFEGRSSSILWKGLMVELARELSTINGIERLGFWDLVTGQAHPASIEP